MAVRGDGHAPGGRFFLNTVSPDLKNLNPEIIEWLKIKNPLATLEVIFVKQYEREYKNVEKVFKIIYCNCLDRCRFYIL
jgi:hypothetical protein